MLNRNDLAKQFEQVVQQEVKNHNDSILATNLSLNEIRSKIKDLNYSLSVHIGKYESDKVDLNSILDEIKSCQDSVALKFNSRLSDIEGSLSALTLHIETLVSKIKSLDEKMDILDKDHAVFEEYAEKTTNFLDNLVTKFYCEIEISRAKAEQNLEKAKFEILSLPCKSVELKKEMELKMATDRVDFSGLMVEINRLKKKNFILEKHVEHLFTKLNVFPKENDEPS